MHALAQQTGERLGAIIAEALVSERRVGRGGHYRVSTMLRERSWSLLFNLEK
jgi:hypothetical protein